MSTQTLPPTPLTRWGRSWRLVTCLVVSAIAWWEVAPQQWAEARGLFALDLAVGLASLVVVRHRRRRPVGVALLLGAVALVSASAAGPGMLAFVSLATRRRYAEIAAVGAVTVLCSQLFFYYQPVGSPDDPPWLTFSLNVVVVVAMALLGMYVGSRRDLLASLRERARVAEAEQELRAEQARSAERERIAREMHDVLAHQISLVTMHSGALAYREDLSPEQVRETASVIQAKAHEAMTDLRQILGLLRDDDGDPQRPQPDLADLDDLVAEARRAGARVEYAALDGPPPAPPVARTVYRIVQEGLTNARKHAPTALVRVSVSGDPDSGVTVLVHNPTSVVAAPLQPGAGLGLVGLRERAELAGGTLEVRRTPAEFVLRGWMPWT